MKIKICGLHRLQDIIYVNQAKPDYAGFLIEYPPSHRSVSYGQLEQLSTNLDDTIQAVGVFVEEAPEKIAELLNHQVIDIAQLHGLENQSYVRRLKKLTEQPIIQAFSIETKDDVIKAENSLADFVLLDHGTGGTGEIFNWKLIQNINRPYLLAGGMNKKTIPFALKQLEPYGIDMSSGVETNHLKDAQKISEIVRMVHNV